MKYYIWFTALVAIIGLVVPVISSAEEGLYDPVPPPGSAFVHFITAENTGKDNQPHIGGKALASTHTEGITSYVPVKTGKKSLQLGDLTQAYTFEEGNYYTVIEYQKKLVVLHDPSIYSPTKAMLVVL